MKSMGQDWRRAQIVGIVLTVAALALGTVVAFYGIRGSGTIEAEEAPEAAAPEERAGPVHAIVLPHEEPDFPPGPNRVTAQAACTTCHSARLVLNQPRLARPQWLAVVQKMATIYGAALPADEQEQIVTYLAAVRGK